MLWILLIKSLYFFLPAYFANMAPVLLRWIPVGNKPLNQQLFGSHKTWRGIVAAILAGSIVFALQKYFFIQGFREWAIIDYSDFSLLLGFLMGAGAIVGDLVKSYFKRKEKIPPGECWLPWDQLDFIFGSLVFSFLVYVPPAEITALIFIVSPVLHVAINYLGYLMGINKQKI